MPGAVYTVVLPEIDDVIAAGYTHVRYYRSASEAGSYSLVGSSLLTAGTEKYTFEDAAATRQSWWQWALWGSGPGETERSEPQPVAFLSFTRREIRQGVGRRLGIMALVTASSGSTSTIVSDDLIDPDASPVMWSNAWVFGLSGANDGAVRRVRAGTNGYAPATGTLTLARALPAAVTSGQQFEVWRHAHEHTPTPDLVNEALNIASSFLWVHDVTYAQTSDLSFELPTLAGIDGIEAVEVQNGDAWVPLPKFDTVQRFGVQTVVLPYKVSGTLRIRFVRHMDRLNSDTDTWEVPLQWAVAEGAFRVLSLLVLPMGNKELVSDIVQSMQLLRAEANQYRRTYGARRPYGRMVAPWM